MDAGPMSVRVVRNGRFAVPGPEQNTASGPDRDPSATLPQGTGASPCPGPEQVVLDRFQHRRQRAGLPPFLLDPVLRASAQLKAVQSGPGRVEFEGASAPLGLDAELDQMRGLARCKLLED